MATIYLTDQQASEHLQEKYSIKRAPTTLKGARCKGTGPRFVYVGGAPRHTEVLLAEWVATLVSSPVASSLQREGRDRLRNATPDTAKVLVAPTETENTTA